MHRAAILVAALVLLAGCASNQQPYTQTDFSQVHEAVATITPLYKDFRAAFVAKNGPTIERDFRREQKACKLVDTIDRRDTIDPTTDLFIASSYLDTFCNDIEFAYAAWRKAHGLSYDKSLKTIPGSYFEDGDYDLKQIGPLLNDPARICCPSPIPASPSVPVPTP